VTTTKGKAMNKEGARVTGLTKKIKKQGCQR
jgi:hypothetical protein